MQGNGLTGEDRERCELEGAIQALDVLMEELEMRLSEARDECMREALDNVIALVVAHESEYRHRSADLRHEPAAT